ncbi:glycosyltransferase family 4 protein [Cohnella herbarum]|uniref:Glycosyltransferase family 4 protein n=1 Tax=Cohnella herbarum TaxID=2728023 RepID=A0A7Z2VLF4_9BACL|nr:glycosyltransferase family 4 protein [Cohnella herbarum]QJD85120.1 glycosyltransferase family 4 protein [Cohnella herbarum]
MKGINLIGYARSEMGIGESCRLAARTLQCSNIPFGILNYSGGNNSRKEDSTWKSKEIHSPIYPINLFHINADQMPLAYETLGSRWFANRLNIGYWHWELPDFPDEYAEGFRHLDEIWVPTSFVESSIAGKSPIPVIRIPHGVQVDVPDNIDRKSFGLPERKFLFLCMYDTFSYGPRKNPYSVLKAYRDSVTRFGLPAGLVIKMNNPQQSEIDNLKRDSEGLPNVWIIDRVLSRMEANALLNCADCYISLHRSEGFGLPLAEAMYLGKPVIGTHWSGNTDFMTTENSGAVRYRLTRIGQNLGPYKAHQLWAEPDVEHAMYLMRSAVYDAEWRKRIALNGQATIRDRFSPEAAGKAIRGRLSSTLNIS